MLHRTVFPRRAARTASPGLKEPPLAPKIAFFLVAILAGFALEWPEVEILPGSYFTLGMSMVLAAAAALGPLPGLLALFAVKALAMARVGNAYIFLFYGLEVAAVGIARRRDRDASILVLDGLYWPLIGMPVAWLVYRQGLGISAPTVAVILLKVWLAGLCNAFLAGIVADSRALSILLGAGTPRRPDMARYVKNRLSLLLMPVVILGLFAVVASFRAQGEEHLAFRVEAGVEAAHLLLDETGRGAGTGVPEDAGRLVAELQSRRNDPTGRFELVPEGEPAIGPGDRPWLRGLFVREPEAGPHPLERWRSSEYFGIVELDGLRIRYSVAFESTYLDLVRIYATAIALSLGLLYGSYGVVSLTARSLSTRIGEIVDSARRLPERIEAGEEPIWPDSGIEETAALAEEFRAVSIRLRDLFAELRDSRDSLEAVVAARTGELELLSEELRLLFARVEREREDERVRIAHELHDELGQGLAGLGMTLYLLERQVEKGKERKAGEIAGKFSDLRGLLAELSEGMRRLVADLRPGLLDRVGLPEALARLAAERAELSGIAIASDCRLPEGFHLSEARKTAAFRVAQEALANAIRHSGSGRIRLYLGTRGSSLVLEVEDEGRGFDPAVEVGAKPRSFGLIGMRERCRAVGGILSVSAAPGAGTLVRARFPSEERS